MLLKAASLSASLLFAMLVVTGSLAWAHDLASTEGHVSIERSAAGKAVKAAKKVASVRKQKRPSLVLAAQTAPAMLPIVAQANLTPRHEELADIVLKALPPHCRIYLKNFSVLYKDAKQRGLGGKTTIILDGQHPDEEFVGLLIHECGHVTHGNMQGTFPYGESAFRDGNAAFYNDSPVISFFAISWSAENVLTFSAKKEDFVSGYARSDAFEDFAETLAAYILHRPMMRERAQTNAAIAAKLEWMERNLPIEENALGESTYAWNGTVPWDVTKLPFVLGSTLIAKK